MLVDYLPSKISLKNVKQSKLAPKVRHNSWTRENSQIAKMAK